MLSGVCENLLRCAMTLDGTRERGFRVSRLRGQVLPFAYPPPKIPPWPALFALNSPARSTT